MRKEELVVVGRTKSYINEMVLEDYVSIREVFSVVRKQVASDDMAIVLARITTKQIMKSGLRLLWDTARRENGTRVMAEPTDDDVALLWTSAEEWLPSQDSGTPCMVITR